MTNPLSAYFRQPALYMTLPSKGRFYPTGTLELGETGELAVMPMTAKDEMALRQPDALMNGSSTVDAIKSCVPGIKDPWQMPTLDLDAVLVAIRIATYGDTMDVECTVPKTNSQHSVQANLIKIMEQLQNPVIDDTLRTHQGLIVKIKPLTYKQLTNIQLRSYEEQRMLRTVNDTTMSEQEKIKHYQDIFNKLTQFNIQQLVDGVVSIQTPDGTTVEDSRQIEEYVLNIDSTTANEIQTAMEQLRSAGAIKPLTVNTPDEDIKKGAPATFETRIAFDNSNFFVQKSRRSRNLK